MFGANPSVSSSNRTGATGSPVSVVRCIECSYTKFGRQAGLCHKSQSTELLVTDLSEGRGHHRSCCPPAIGRGRTKFGRQAGLCHKSQSPELLVTASSEGRGHHRSCGPPAAALRSSPGNAVV